MFRVNALSICAVVQFCICVVHALDCKSSTTITISSRADVVALNKCINITAPITITSSAPADIQLEGPKSLATLNATASKSLHSISSSTLIEIDSLTLADLPVLHALNFSALDALDKFDLNDLPALENVTFGGLGPRSVISIINTGLEGVDWMKWPVATSLNISSNANLEEISLPWDSIDGVVTISQNEKLDTLDIFAVKSIPGNLTVEGNAGLKNISFGALQNLTGDVQLSGGFNHVSMPALKVAGNLVMTSTEDMGDPCEKLDPIGDKGHIKCLSNSRSDPPASGSPKPSNTPGSPPLPLGPSPSSPADGQGEGDIATGAKIGIVLASVILGVFFVVGAVFFFRARSRGKVQEIVISAPIPMSPPNVSSRQSAKSVDAISVGKVESAEARVVGTRAGGVKVVLNGEEMSEVDMAGARREGGGVGKAGMEREASLKSISSVGSEVPLVKRGSPV